MALTARLAIRASKDTPASLCTGSACFVSHPQTVFSSRNPQALLRTSSGCHFGSFFRSACASALSGGVP
jgi:hydroxyethylthiazole kinase-like sugar kinase family protein